MKKEQEGTAPTAPTEKCTITNNTTLLNSIKPSDTLNNQKKWINKLQSLPGSKPILIKCLEGAMPPGADPDLYNWMHYKDVMHKAFQTIYTRGTLPFEIVIDFDVKDWNVLKSEGDKLISFLKSANIPYLLAYTGGNGLHGHIFMQPVEFNMSDLQEYDVDVVKAVRQSVCEAILQDANVKPADIGLDKKKINFNKDSKGSQVREFGTIRPDWRYKTLINEIPTAWPKVNPALIFPAEVLQWDITPTKYYDVAREAVKAAIEKAKQGNTYVLDDVDFADTNPMQYPCINKLITQGLDNGRYYGAGAVILMSKKCGLTKEEAAKNTKQFLSRCNGLSAAGAELRLNNAAKMWEEDRDFSCNYVKDNIDSDFCKFRECPICAKLEDSAKNNNNFNRKNHTQAGILISKALCDNVTLFHDDTQEPYARVCNDEACNMILPVQGRQFKRWLQQQYYKDTKDAAGSEAFNSALNVIEAEACFNGEEFKLHNRVCAYGGAFWFDTGDWRAVRIDQSGWSVVNEPPIMFRRYSHQKPLSLSQTTAKGGNVRGILAHMNIKKEDELLFLVYLCSLYVPDIPHTILILHGEKGAAKTTTSKVIKSLVDPSALEVISFPTNSAELIQKLSHHYFAGFDNVTHLSDYQSDTLCRASTGEGNSKRALYTNDEDVIYSYRRCVAINGINNVATKSDLLDRSLLINVERVPSNERLTEGDFWATFDNEKTTILAGIFNTVSAAMKIHSAGNINKQNLPRMADFAVWGCAIAEALGYSHQDFLSAYEQNIQAQNREALEGSPVGELVLHLMDQCDSWKGKPAELLSELVQIAEEKKINIKTKDFPKAANAMTRRLNEIKSNLRDENITFESWHSSCRHILLRKIPSLSTLPTKQEQEPPKGAVGIKDGILDTDHTDRIPTNTKQEQEDDKDGILCNKLYRQIELYAKTWQTSNGPVNSSNIDTFVMNFIIDQVHTGKQHEIEDVKVAAIKIFKIESKPDPQIVTTAEVPAHVMDELQESV